MPLKIKGIIRLKDGVTQGILQEGIAYTPKLVNRVLSDNMKSTIVKGLSSDQKATIYPIPTYLTPGLSKELISQMITTGRLTSVMGIKAIYSNTAELGGSNNPIKLSFYSIDYQAKEDLKVHLDAWNEVEGRLEKDEVHYSDASDMLFTAMNMMVDGVKIVLVAFTSISLIVSSIMIGIITYVSVVERTKEIGVLRSLGARKKDVSRIFNAETFLIGLFAGILGIGITYLLSIPINLIVGGLIGAKAICSLRVVDALILVVVSFILTLISGLIPARIAAKKDPVVALRTE
jgi:ABC-type antimicrobial peptide transport system permease subunit